MSFQWDTSKAKSNEKKHGVAFADAVGAFEDPHALTNDDPHPNEDRFVTMGVDLLGRVIVVAWTGRLDEIRIISARKANRREREQYQNQE